jgi:hypothetical protein
MRERGERERRQIMASAMGQGTRGESGKKEGGMKGKQGMEASEEDLAPQISQEPLLLTPRT